jgi:hypothetical protein
MSFKSSGTFGLNSFQVCLQPFSENVVLKQQHCKLTPTSLGLLGGSGSLSENSQSRGATATRGRGAASGSVGREAETFQKQGSVKEQCYNLFFTICGWTI